MSAFLFESTRRTWTTACPMLACFVRMADTACSSKAAELLAVACCFFGRVKTQHFLVFSETGRHRQKIFCCQSIVGYPMFPIGFREKKRSLWLRFYLWHLTSATLFMFSVSSNIFLSAIKTDTRSF